MRISFSNSIATAIAVTALTAISAPALAQSSDITQFTEENVMSALSDQNIDFEKRIIDGTTFLVGEKDGYRVTLAFTACGDNNECMGLQMQSSWGKSEKVSQSVMAERIRKFNNDFDFVKANMYDSGGFYVGRYAICDYGIKPATLRSNFTNFMYLLGEFDVRVVQGNVPS